MHRTHLLRTGAASTDIVVRAFEGISGAGGGFGR